jgi:preprotein translocase SecE subunit
MKRSRKTISLIYLACAAITWFIMRELIATVWVITRLSQPLDWIVAPTDILATVIALIVFVAFIRSEKINLFTNEVITELGEVIWPGRKETVLSTGVVSVLVGICAVILFGFDMIWGIMVRLFYR